MVRYDLPYSLIKQVLWKIFAYMVLFQNQNRGETRNRQKYKKISSLKMLFSPLPIVTSSFPHKYS